MRISEFCKTFQVSHQAVYAKIKKYAVELDGHISKDKGCHKKAVRKDYIEEAVLLEVADKMFTEDMIEKIADKVMVLQDKEDTAIPLLKKELAETEKYIDNLIDAMQMGMLTKSTKQRLDELEARKEQLEADIINEEINSRKLSRGQVIDWLKKMKSLDLASDDNKRSLRFVVFIICTLPQSSP